jgi:hypothetical protein
MPVFFLPDVVFDEFILKFNHTWNMIAFSSISISSSFFGPWPLSVRAVLQCIHAAIGSGDVPIAMNCDYQSDSQCQIHVLPFRWSSCLVVSLSYTFSPSCTFDRKSISDRFQIYFAPDCVKIKCPPKVGTCSTSEGNK